MLFSAHKVAGVGYKNSLRLTMNSTVSGVPVKYRVFISEAGTTVSKVLKRKGILIF